MNELKNSKKQAKNNQNLTKNAPFLTKNESILTKENNNLNQQKNLLNWEKDKEKLINKYKRFLKEKNVILDIIKLDFLEEFCTLKLTLNNINNEIQTLINDGKLFSETDNNRGKPKEVRHPALISYGQAYKDYKAGYEIIEQWIKIANQKDNSDTFNFNNLYDNSEEK